MVIEHEELCSLIPHTGTMCLLDRVLQWNDESILCQTMSHRDTSNPLCTKRGLSSVNAVEYGAQAMAVHGGLLNGKTGLTMHRAYLAAARDVEINTAWLNIYDCPLLVQAQRLMGDDKSMIYLFSVYANDETLVKGRVIVVAEKESAI